MAFCRTVGLALKPIFVNPCFIIPSSVNLQVRHAARKGYREKVKKAKQASTLLKTPAVSKELARIKTKYDKIEKTINLRKPEPPPDDIFITDLFNYKKYSVAEAVSFHKEYHHPEVYNNPNAVVSLRIEIDMTAKKSTQFIKPFSGVSSIPHPFTVSHRREILVFCGPEKVELALASGASTAGGADIVKKMQEGVVQPSLYDYIIADTDFLPHLVPLRNILKEKYPKANKGTVTNDLKSSIYRFLHGIEYVCVQPGSKKDFGVIDCNIGLINMELNQLEENFQILVDDIEKHRPPRGGDFISWIWCLSRPSNEEFSLDLSRYIKTMQVEEDDDDDDDEVIDEKQQEKVAMKKLLEKKEELGTSE